MATTRPFAYNTGPTISGTIQVGDIAVGVDAFDYSEQPGGVRWWNGPDEDLGYVITHPTPSGTQPNQLGIPAFVGFWRSDVKTEESFIQLAEWVSAYDNNPQTFTGGTEAKDWLNTNGFWTSYADIWQYNPLINLTWPSSTAGYTLYTGGVTSIDDGYTNTPILSLDAFEMNSEGPSNQVYVSTNGYITFGNGSAQIISSPQGLSNPAPVCGNPSDNWLQPGLIMTDGDTQNIYYMTGGTVGKSYIKFIVYGGTYGNATQPTSWLLNYYIDGQYQWVETRIKSNVRGNAGPYNNTDVSIGASTTSRVWQGDLLGQNWVYLGSGSIND